MLWLLSAIILTVIFGSIYMTVHQSYRHLANDPQIEITEEVAAAIKQGADIQSMLPAANTDIGQSLSPFVLLYDKDGKAVGGSGMLDGQTPTPPEGIFAFVREHGEERLTWEPKPGVRIAAVVKRLDGDPSGFVLAGRSLREVEARAKQLTITVGVGWGASIVLSLLMLLVANGTLKRKEKPAEEPAPPTPTV